ncbi:MAG: TonB-dependent receptor, partial [Myxococcota bacterium]
PTYDALNAGVFAHGRLDWNDFAFELGGRYDRRNVTAALGNGFTRTETTDEDFSFDAVSLALGSAWRPTGQFELRADLSSASRAPSAVEQFTDGRIPGLPGLVLGDIDMGVETAWNLSVGASYGWSWGRAQVSAYASMFDDFIYFSPFIQDGEPFVSLTIRGALPVFTYSQVDARILGGEASVELELLRDLEWKTSASYVNGRNTTDDEFLVFIPPLRVQNSLTWRLPWEGVFYGSFLSVQSVVVLEQTDFEPSTDFAPPPDGYHLLSFAGGTTTEIGEQELELGVSVNNALNERYRVYTSLQRYFTDEPGLSVIARAALRFSI